MRAALLALAVCAAGAAAQVSYAPARGAAAPGGDGGGPRRRRVRPGRRPRPEPQLDAQQTLVPFNQQEAAGSPPPSRQQFQPFQPYRPLEAAAEPTYQPEPRPQPEPAAPVTDRRSSSRYRPQQLDFADYETEQDGSTQQVIAEDYEEEPDRLSILMQESSFRCDPSAKGYYADDTVDCEVFHYCAAGVKHSWICPDGNRFHQINLICMAPDADNICKRSSDFHFVNEYLYQQINNDSLQPQYADRYYPDSAAQLADAYADRPPLQASYSERQPPASAPRRRRPRPQLQQQQQQQQQRRQQQQQQYDFELSGNGFGGADFRHQKPSSVLRPQKQRKQVQQFKPSSAFDQHDFVPPTFAEASAASAAVTSQSLQRRDDPQPLPPVRPPSNPYPAVPLQPSINFRGAPRPAQERRDDIVLGGFQGNVDIEELASRIGQ